jgi:hypothetical protein
MPAFFCFLSYTMKSAYKNKGVLWFCQWRFRNAQLWRNKSDQADKYLLLIQLNLKTTASAILRYLTLFSAIFKPIAIAFDVNGSTVMQYPINNSRSYHLNLNISPHSP